MKINIKSFLSIAIILSMVMSAMPVFADSEYMSLGTPYDVTDNEYTTDLEAGHIIAVPVDITSSSTQIQAYAVVVKYDTSVLSPGALLTTLNADDYLLYDRLGDLGAVIETGDYCYAVSGIYTSGRYGNTDNGTTDANPDYTNHGAITSGDHFYVGWYSTGDDLQTDAPETYMVFTVLDDVDDLNYSAIELATDYTVVDAANGVDGETTKANACDGAFQINVDSSKLSYWVQAVTVNIDGTDYALDACVNEDGSTTYSFPVRVTSAADDTSVTATITATVTDDVDGTTNEQTVDWGTVTVDMTGAATSYAATSVN